MLRSLDSMATTDMPGRGACRFDRDDERWRLVETVLASPLFCRSPRLSSFLIYICEKTLEGAEAELNERAIGMHVFGRPSDYNPGDDSIVRSQARLLRGRLEQFFLEEGQSSEWRLIVPKGSYVPIFERRTADMPSVPVVEAPQENRSRWWLALLGGCLLLLLWGGTRWLRNNHGRAERQPSPLWSVVFEGNRPTVMVPADSTLSVIEGRSSSPVPLSDYLKHNYPAPLPETPLRMNDYQLTSIADLKMAVRVARLPEAQGQRLEVKYPRDLTINDAREANLILVGGIRANPWVQLFTNQMHFQIEAGRVIDSLPREGEASTYSLELEKATPRSYGIVAWLPGLAGGHTLVVEGSDMAGTEAAGQFLFDDAAFQEFARRLGATRGSLPHFEVLLAAMTLNGNASHFQVLAWHRIPNSP